MEREEEFLERNIPNLRQQIQLADRRYDLETDKTYFKYLLQRLSGMEAERVPATVQNIIAGKSGAEIDRYVDRLYAQSMLADAEKRLKMIDMTPEELRQTNDPFLQLAADLDKELSERREKQKALDQSLKDLKKTYIAGLLEFKNGELAPDANGTIRFTYGPVKGYSPRDAVEYLPQTTLSGVIEKDTGEKPFRVPEKLKALEAVKDFGQYEDEELGDVPACFLNTTNVTGGNSGSPALNAKGEQIGIIFDMTYESVIGDYYVIPELQRTISVDIRYVLFVTEKFSGAEYIIHELGLD